MRATVFAVMTGCALALAGAAQAQKTVLPGMQTTPPPKQVLPGSPTTPPPMHSPDMDTTLGRSAPSDGSRNYQGPSVGSGTMSGSQGGISREEARRRFEQCLSQNTRSGTVSGVGLANCVGGWMPPAELSRFNTCWNDNRTTAWECFGRAYN